MCLDGKVALVTGGSRGLGKEMVSTFASHGASTIVASRDFDTCQNVAEDVTARFGTKSLPVRCNVGLWSDCDSLVATAYQHFGRVDILVNNAGKSPFYPSLDLVGEAMWDKVIGLNLKGPFRLAASIGTRMAAAGGGSIINISSIAAMQPEPEALPYAAAKAGLNALTEGFAQAFGPTVRVNTIQCGAFRTTIADAWTPAFVEQLKEGVALRRPGNPHEVVGAVMFFATDESSFCTGATLRLDGGAHRQRYIMAEYSFRS